MKNSPKPKAGVRAICQTTAIEIGEIERRGADADKWIMSKSEKPLLRRYWATIGGTLIEEFPAVRRGPDHEARNIDGVIIHGTEQRTAKPNEVDLRGKSITIVQVKTGRLRMSLMGQALFSLELMRPFDPASVQSIALCETDDAVLRPLFERHPNCHVITVAELATAEKKGAAQKKAA
jgi:hypothetical protein